LLAVWKRSGKTREILCREQGVGKESLRRWTKRLRGTDPKVPLVQITGVASVAAKAVPIHLRVLVSGEVQILGEFSEELLRRVLRVMREAVDVS
jgi:hypothetical protein